MIARLGDVGEGVPVLHWSQSSIGNSHLQKGTGLKFGMAVILNVCHEMIYPLKSSIYTQNSHVWKEIHVPNPSFFGIYVRFWGRIFEEVHHKQSHCLKYYIMEMCWIARVRIDRGHYMGPIWGESNLNNRNLWWFSAISLLIMHGLGLQYGWFRKWFSPQIIHF